MENKRVTFCGPQCT